MSSDRLTLIVYNDQRVWFDASKFVYSEISSYADRKFNSIYNYDYQNAQDDMFKFWCLEISLSGSPELIRIYRIETREKAIELEQAILEEVKQSY